MNTAEAAATGRKRGNMLKRIELETLEKPSIPSGFRIGPRPFTGPEENAPDMAPTKTKATVSHVTHCQCLLGSLPVGNSSIKNTEKPIMIGKSQEETQAIASPAGSELGWASKV